MQNFLYELARGYTDTGERKRAESGPPGLCSTNLLFPGVSAEHGPHQDEHAQWHSEQNFDCIKYPLTLEKNHKKKTKNNELRCHFSRQLSWSVHHFHSTSVQIWHNAKVHHSAWNVCLVQCGFGSKVTWQSEVLILWWYQEQWTAGDISQM